MSDPVSMGSSTAAEVTVVVPSHNRCAALQRCLEALAAQTHPDFEVIVVDDGSTDATPEMLREFIAAHPELRVRVLRNEHCIGANPSRNRAIREARGRFVAFKDSDCAAVPDWLIRLSAAFAHDNVAAVVGLVKDLPPRNLFELTFKGTHRMAGAGPAHRLVGSNMCVRRDLLLRYLLDEDRATQAFRSDGSIDVAVSGRGDEEGLYLMLRAAGYEIQTAPDAVVEHDHPYSGRAFFKQAFRGGRSAARLVYKFHLSPRLDMIPFILAYLFLPLGLRDARLLAVPGFFLGGAVAAILYNDLFRKGKTVWETLITFPILMAYYHVRLAGYVLESIRLRLGSADIRRVRLVRKKRGQAGPGFRNEPDARGGSRS